MKEAYIRALERAQAITPLNIGGSRWSDRHWTFCQLWGIGPEVARQWLAVDMLKEDGCAPENLPDK